MGIGLAGGTLKASEWYPAQQGHEGGHSLPFNHSHSPPLEEAYKSNVMVLEWEANVEEGRECQAFAEAFYAVMQACLPEAWGTFNYPLQVLTGNVLLAAFMGMTTAAWLQAMKGHNGYTQIHPTTIYSV